MYPSSNLVLNIGFGRYATHTRKAPPPYWHKSAPEKNASVMKKVANFSMIPNRARDRYLIKVIWHFGLLTLIRITIMNIIRYAKA